MLTSHDGCMNVSDATICKRYSDNAAIDDNGRSIWRWTRKKKEDIYTYIYTHTHTRTHVCVYVCVYTYIRMHVSKVRERIEPPRQRAL